MKFNKKFVADMKKAYAVSPIKIYGKQCFIVGTEKEGPLNIFDSKGRLIETIFEDFGGVMSIVPLVDEENAFLTTYKFYSPNDGYDAKIVYVKKIDGKWSKEVLVDLPFVHRFDVLYSGKERFLVCCTIKSGFEFRNDWNQPGRIYVGKLDDDLSKYNEDFQLKLDELDVKLSKNHGFYKVDEKQPYCLITAVEGVFKLCPGHDSKEWQLEKILDQSTSDALYYDLDGDGKRELVTISEFHGDHLDIFKEEKGEFYRVFSYKKPLRFLHALHAAKYKGKPILFVGHREAERDLFCLEYNQADHTYVRTDIEDNLGVANITSFREEDKLKIVVTHRETDQVCLYDIED